MGDSVGYIWWFDGAGRVLAPFSFVREASVSLQRNVIYLTIEKAVHTLGGLLSMVLVGRTMGQDALGDYGFAISLTAFFIPALDLGLNNRVIKDVASGKDARSVVEDVLGYKLTVSPVLYLLMSVAGWFWAGPEVAAVVMLVGISTIAMSVGDSANSVFKGLQISHISCLLISALNVALLGSLYASLRNGGGLQSVGWCFALSRIGYAGLAFALLRSQTGLTPAVRPRLDTSVIRSGVLHLPGIYFLGNLLYLTYLATYVVSPHVAGVYYVGYRAAAAVYVLVSAGFEAVLASAMSREHRPTGLGMWFVIYSVIALLLLYLAAPLSVMVFGESFAESVRPVRLLASCIPTFALCGLAHTLLLAAHRERFAALTMLVLVVSGFGSAVAAELLSGPEMTARAPALASTIAMIVLWVALSRQVRASA